MQYRFTVSCGRTYEVGYRLKGKNAAFPARQEAHAAEGFGSRGSDFLAALIPLAHVTLDDRIAAGEAALVTQPIEHTLGGYGAACLGRRIGDHR
ncbi:hypothetical protein HNQ75_004566 [Rhizobium flavum]|uniref:Uncharacterized protein n=2 Tax=Pseudorhizobium flavum TaxID=1335061 RepID=A0A7W9Z201_9HYPH|nr:hypothetical protein [Pseudorhizobium flavum]CAD6599068.1 hypothetical protein RFYW14_00640 [Pseudorhizobium flavum]